MAEEAQGEKPNDKGEGTSQDKGQETTTTEQSTEAVEVQSQNIDWSTVDVSSIPEDVLKEHPAFKSVLSESIERRKEIAQLKKQTSTQKQGDNVDNATEQTAPEENTSNALEAKLNTLETMMNRMIDMQADREMNDIRKQLAAAHNVPAGRIKYITGETFEELEASAKELGDAQGGVNGKTSSGNAGGGESARQALRQRIRATVEDKGTESSSIFDPGTQRVRGGGAIR